LVLLLLLMLRMLLVLLVLPVSLLLLVGCDGVDGVLLPKLAVVRLKVVSRQGRHLLLRRQQRHAPAPSSCPCLPSSGGWGRIQHIALAPRPNDFVALERRHAIGARGVSSAAHAPNTRRGLVKLVCGGLWGEDARDELTSLPLPPLLLLLLLLLGMEMQMLLLLSLLLVRRGANRGTRCGVGRRVPNDFPAAVVEHFGVALRRRVGLLLVVLLLEMCRVALLLLLLLCVLGR